jgi:hypothetical protein
MTHTYLVMVAHQHEGGDTCLSPHPQLPEHPVERLNRQVTTLIPEITCVREQ